VRQSNTHITILIPKIILNHIRTPIIHSVDVADALVSSTTVRSHVTTVRHLPTHLYSRFLGWVQGLECVAAEPAPAAAAQLSGTITPATNLPGKRDADSLRSHVHRQAKYRRLVRGPSYLLETWKPKAARGFLAEPTLTADHRLFSEHTVCRVPELLWSSLLM
jgi:hypothetical protein